ncbi:MAG: ROK family protein [Gemmatimonadetes bacterium]|nr:ROK family protein [Gemmatimonadota bacterium]
MRRINTRAFHRATRSTSREINRQIVLNLVREHQPVSRADLARRMNVARGMAGSLVRELLVEGSLVEGAVSDVPRGRKPVMLYVRTQDRLAVAIDVRFSRTYVMLTDFAGTQVALETFDTLFCPTDLVEELTRRVNRLVETYAALGSVEGVGVVVPGMVDRDGRVLYAPQLGWRQVDIRDALAAGTGLPVHIENASTACAIAQMWLVRRAGDSAADFVYVNISDGVGVGVVVNGQLVRGHGHTAGEFGHIPIDPRGPRCVCGSVGCWETFTSNIATLTRYLGREPSAAESRQLLHEQELTIVELIARARGGDERALESLLETGRYMGVGLAMIVNALNPARIIVGGEITAAWDLIQQELADVVAARALTPAAAETHITPEQTSDHPRLRGATALVAAPLFAAPQVA